jgi:phosphatidylserine/phosphatidylglycerophosphate/cardiolipin synthase-like enzyme
MAEFLTTQHTAYRIEQIVSKASRKIVLLSPFVRLSPRLFERLEDASRRGVPITLVLGKTEPEIEELERLSSLRGVRLYFCQDLHAKCYYNEAQLVVTSLNLLESSEKKNWEMGVLVSSTDPMYSEAVAEAEAIIRHSAELHAEAAESFEEGPAYCIQCRVPQMPDLSRPYCRTCFLALPTKDDWGVQENYCHYCGKKWATSRARPLCATCWSQASLRGET